MSRFNLSGHAVLNGAAHDDPPSPKQCGGQTKGGQDGNPPTKNAKLSGVSLTLDQAKEKLELIFSKTPLLKPTKKQRENMTSEVLKLINNPELPPNDRLTLKQLREQFQADRMKKVAKLKEELWNAVKMGTADMVVEAKPSPRKQHPAVNHK
ncbi:MAG: hypothetical protein KF864_04550 [Phycisphaeraceae bacterium]|nr:hypothetical protein [Phycisphaeraceae bacterium]